MQTYKELVAQAHEYLNALDKGKLNKYEKLFVKSMLEDKNDLREYSFSGEIISQMPLINATALVNAGGALPICCLQSFLRCLLTICKSCISTHQLEVFTASVCANAMKTSKQTCTK